MRAITNNEFARWFRRCVPPRIAPPSSIAVANSGGPDSTCLLFLIHRYLSDKTRNSHSTHPQAVVSLTVDHDLQVSSSATADHCAKFARSLGVRHLSTRIPWSTPPFPPHPEPGEMFENTARDARYHSLFQLMTRENIPVIALGHHADDQVETALMRLGRGSTKLGAAGMRPCRRWGMGLASDENALGYAGYEGMNRWIVRPLLDVSKDRILATCQENHLEYIVDNTNFQPHVTLRNALRQRIQGNGTDTSQKPISADIQTKLASIETAASSLESVSINLDDGPQQLRSTISVLAENLEDIDCQVNSILKRCRLSSFPGTFLVSSRAISSIRDQTLRRAIVLRVLRYVSFHPWGTIRADGKRRMESVDHIIRKLWDPTPFHSKNWIFVAGAGVLWTPVAVRGSRIKTPDRVFASGLRSDEVFGWLASRQPPLARRKMKERGIPNTLEIDVTGKIIEALRQRNGSIATVSVLWDCRYLVRFDLERIPADFAARLLRPENEEKLMIYSSTRWYWPKVVRETKGTAKVIHSEIDEVRSSLLLLEEGLPEGDAIYWRANDERVSSAWISIEWIRSLDAI